MKKLLISCILCLACSSAQEINRMRLPAYTGDDPQLRTLFRYIDEQLSELYGLHGNLTTQSATQLTTPVKLLGDTLIKGVSPLVNSIYKNSVTKAWGTAFDGVMYASFNLAIDNYDAATGRYTYKFLTPMQPATAKNYAGEYVVLVTCSNTAPALPNVPNFSTVAVIDETKFLVRTWNVNPGPPVVVAEGAPRVVQNIIVIGNQD